MQELRVTSPAFSDNGQMPIEYTGFGKDISPALELTNLNEQTISIAVVLEDLDIPFVPAFSHWVIWNIPKTEVIPKGIPAGDSVPMLSGAVQGMAYGAHRYRGPKQPPFVRNTHRYRFSVYALDCFLQLDANAGKAKLEQAMKGHILQVGNLTGTYRRR